MRTSKIFQSFSLSLLNEFRRGHFLSLSSYLLPFFSTTNLTFVIDMEIGMNVYISFPFEVHGNLK